MEPVFSSYLADQPLWQLCESLIKHEIDVSMVRCDVVSSIPLDCKDHPASSPLAICCIPSPPHETPNPCRAAARIWQLHAVFVSRAIDP